jgi:hypothetical protein
MMVFLHGLHGLALDWAAARFGGRRRLGLRFGLYSCGWDLATLPLGLVVLAFSAGPRVALQTAPLGVTLPPKAAHAYLTGVQHLDHDAAVAAGRLASTLAGVAALVCGTAVVVVIAMVVAW